MLKRNDYLKIAFAVAIIASGQFAPVKADPIHLTYNADFPPYSYGQDEQVTGILPELMKELIKKRMGLEVYNVGLCWEKAQKLVELG